MKQLLITLTILLGLSSTIYAGGHRGQDRYYGHENYQSGRYEQSFGRHKGHKRPHHIKKHHIYYNNKHRPYYAKKHHHKHHRNGIYINSVLLGFLLGTSY